MGTLSVVFALDAAVAVFFVVVQGTGVGFALWWLALSAAVCGVLIEGKTKKKHAEVTTAKDERHQEAAASVN